MRGLGRGCVRRRQNDLKHTEPNGKTYRRVRPGFSEDATKAVIKQITDAIEAAGGVKLLDVDPGEATNRTVVTFVGEPEAVLEAAFAGVKKAAEVIDMRHHKGAHPRMGATDVLPLIPIAGITLEECAELARPAWPGASPTSLHVPTYCYEAAAFTPERRNLAVCRAGEYEALPEKMTCKEKAPDFGARAYDEGVARHGRDGRRCAVFLTRSITTSIPPPRAVPTPSRSTCARRAVPCARATPSRARLSRTPPAIR